MFSCSSRNQPDLPCVKTHSWFLEKQPDHSCEDAYLKPKIAFPSHVSNSGGNILLWMQLPGEGSHEGVMWALEDEPEPTPLVCTEAASYDIFNSSRALKQAPLRSYDAAVAIQITSDQGQNCKMQSSSLHIQHLPFGSNGAPLGLVRNRPAVEGSQNTLALFHLHPAL